MLLILRKNYIKLADIARKNDYLASKLKGFKSKLTSFEVTRVKSFLDETARNIFAGNLKSSNRTFLVLGKYFRVKKDPKRVSIGDV